MKIIKINPNNPENEAINEAVEVLKNGGVIVYPTDTCYGLGTDMANIFGVDKLYKIKGKDTTAPISVIIKDIATIKKMALMDEKQEKFLRKYLPGPLTIILLNLDYEHFKHMSIGFRIPKYKICQLIAEKFNRPYATTSANISGNPPTYSLREIEYQFRGKKDQPDLILDAGRLSKNPPSTVVDIIRRPPRILRKGSVKIEEAR